MFLEELMVYVRTQLTDKRMLPYLSKNPRSLKRLCNIITLALSCYRESGIRHEEAFYLMLVIVMVEQWPFRYAMYRNTGTTGDDLENPSSPSVP